MHPNVQAFHWSFFAAGLMLAAGWDVAQRRVPNWLNVALSITGLAARFLTHGYWNSAFGVAGVVLGIAILFYPFARGWVGAGDVKLLSAVGAWLGPLLLVYAALASSLMGGLLALIYFFRSPPEIRREIGINLRLTWLLRCVPEAEERPKSLAPPYAVAIALGSAAVVALYLSGYLQQEGYLFEFGFAQAR